MNDMKGAQQADGLDKMVARLKELRGPADVWLERETALTKFIARLNDTTRVFCRGEVRNSSGHYPAVLTFNTIYRQTLAWAPSGRKNAMEAHHEANFHSNVPHVSIAREVLSGPETTAQLANAPER